MITRALFVRLEAKTGREQEVERFLRSALDIVDTEDGTPLWFALRFGPSTFGIFDAFPDEDGREAHLSGRSSSSESGRQDLNLRPPGPQPGALPDCATPRGALNSERATGIEPALRAWKAPVQPQHFARKAPTKRT